LQQLAKIFRWSAKYLNRKDYASTSSLFKLIGTSQLHISLERYFIALNIVKSYGNSISNVLLSDSRDVVIQKDPFSLINQKLVTGLEGNKIGACQYNSSWIKQIYGDEVLNQISDKQIICSGVTLGTRNEIEKYLTVMCDEIWQCLPRVNKGFGFDQGIHNYLIHQNKIDAELAENHQGTIATLQYENQVNMYKNPVNRLVEIQGEYPAILHQYDRYPDLLEFFSV
jgi:hypothetical protein